MFDATANPIVFKDDTDGENINQDIEQTPDYEYDANGNMIKDTNKGITNITYNHLNLPTKIVVGSNNIEYLYNATGQKLNKKVTQATNITNTDYLTGFQYKNSVLQFFPHAEGYVNATQNGTSYTFNYVYNYTDHLGNIRLSYSQDPSTNVLKIIEENHYYPFGLKHTGYNSDQMMYVKEEYIVKIKPKPLLFKTSYNYKYNGKELQDELGLNMYDYGARNYDPALGRWMNIDPLAEIYRRHTPYAYAINNPIFFIDPDGMRIVNGMTAIRERFESQNKGQKANIDSKYGGQLGLSKKDFVSQGYGSKDDYENYKTSVKNFKSSSKLLEKAIQAEANVQEAIKDFENIDPVNFDIADNLSVDIIVGAGSKSQIKQEPMSQYGGAVTESAYGKDVSGATFVSAIYTTLDFNSVSQVVTALIELAKSDARWSELGNAGYDYVVANHNWETDQKRFISALEDFLVK